MTITLIIPALNEEKYLPNTLASVKALDRQPDEIIVVNAQSEDKTAEIAKSFGAKIITVDRRSIGYSRNKGLKAATSDIVAYTDADTILPRDWLSTIVSHIEKDHAVGVFGGFRVPDGPWWYRLYINVFQPFANTLTYAMFTVPFATGQNMAFYRTNALSAGGFPEDFKIAEDIEIARRVMSTGKIVFSQNFFVVASGRRGFEGFWQLISRSFSVFFYYFIYRKADKIGFPDIR
ncbi:glycosyltransferase [Candidatus Gottesmanbacteria bacterium]|nr:glycosyltransferase [Candidatus Gottesmanbacteria bacterium]